MKARFLGGLAASLMFFSAVQAQVLTYLTLAGVPDTDTEWTATLSGVQRFNPGLGDLTQVRISFTGEVAQSFFVLAPAHYTLTNQVTLTLGIPGGPIVATPGSVLNTLSGDLATGFLNPTLTTPINFDLAYADPAHLALFLGSGPIDLMAHAFEDVLTSTSVSGNGAGGSSSTASLGLVTVEYTYAAIPEPATLTAVLGLAVFGLVLGRRHLSFHPAARP